MSDRESIAHYLAEQDVYPLFGRISLDKYDLIDQWLETNIRFYSQMSMVNLLGFCLYWKRLYTPL